jgi:phosphatidylinositol-3,4,5-trisphosphate 3-phosphatase/dual-specificity protein phosphatase PTEN
MGTASPAEYDKPPRSKVIEVNDPPARATVPRSTNSSTTTLSHPSPPPSIDIHVETTPPYEAMDVGDEGRPEEAGQRDRMNGRVDAVFKLHSSRRMKPTSSGRGVSIPSRAS